MEISISIKPLVAPLTTVCAVVVFITLLLVSNADAQEPEPYLYDVTPLLAVSRDGRVAAIAGRRVPDSTARLEFRYPIDFYDTESGALLNTYGSEDDAITGLSLTPDGTLLAYNTGFGDLRVIDVQSGSHVHIVSRGGSLETGYPRWNADGTQLARFAGRGLQLFAIYPKSRLGSFYAEQGDIVGYDWSDDGSTIAVSMIQPTSRQGSLAVLDVDETGQLTLRNRFDSPSSLVVEVNVDGSSIATSVTDGLLITHAEDGSQQLLENPIAGMIQNSIAWNPLDSRIAVSTFEHIFIWDSASGDFLQTLEVEGAANDIFWSADGCDLFHAGPQGVYRNNVPIGWQPATTPTESPGGCADARQ